MAGLSVTSPETTSTPHYVTQEELGPILDAWYAKKKPLETGTAKPNTEIYNPSYSGTATTASTTSAPTATAEDTSAPRPSYGWRPSPYMGGFSSPFSGYGSPFGMMGGGYGGYGGMGGYGSYMGGYYPSSGFGMGGMGYGPMYTPFSTMY